MDAIAHAAGVNKALLYYYFASKDGLYLAALEAAAVRVRDSSLAAAQVAETAGRRFLRMVLNHFDRILSQREFQSLMQQEMIRLHKGDRGNLPVLVEKIFRPLYATFEATVQEGIGSGELITVDWLQMVVAGLGANVFYFLSAPMWALIGGENPMDLSTLAARRRRLVEYLGLAIFIDRAEGAKAAAELLAAVPMPETVNLPKPVEAK